LLALAGVLCFACHAFIFAKREPDSPPDSSELPPAEAAHLMVKTRPRPVSQALRTLP
jgi:hypothetical protein